MSRYILRNDFQKLAEASGTVVNISTAKAELSETAEFGTGVILYPRKKISFSSPIYAAKAAGESGTAVIGVIHRTATNSDGSTFYDGDDDANEFITDEEIAAIVNGEKTPSNNSPPEGDEYITDAELRKLFNGG